MKKKYIYLGLAILLIALILVSAWFLLNSQKAPESQTNSTSTHQETTTTSTNFTFENPKKSAHYETNTPAHGAVLAGVPVNVVLDFNFDVAKPSSIEILKDGVDYSVGETTIDANKLTLRRAMKSDSPDGLYTVKYIACWPDTSCHDGSFQFEIEKAVAASFEDQTGKSEVTVRLSDFVFAPQNIRISKGTKVTWINDDSAEHFINSDSHPAHTYYLAQNSRGLAKGGSFSLTFDQVGIYLYHCSAHPETMSGNLLVE